MSLVNFRVQFINNTHLRSPSFSVFLHLLLSLCQKKEMEQDWITVVVEWIIYSFLFSSCPSFLSFFLPGSCYNKLELTSVKWVLFILKPWPCSLPLWHTITVKHSVFRLFTEVNGRSEKRVMRSKGWASDRWCSLHNVLLLARVEVPLDAPGIFSYNS